MSELKPCPFCGDQKTVMLQHMAQFSYVECGECCATGSHEVVDEDAIDAWNQRPKEMVCPDCGGVVTIEHYDEGWSVGCDDCEWILDGGFFTEADAERAFEAACAQPEAEEE